MTFTQEGILHVVGAGTVCTYPSPVQMHSALSWLCSRTSYELLRAPSYALLAAATLTPLRSRSFRGPLLFFSAATIPRKAVVEGSGPCPCRTANSAWYWRPRFRVPGVVPEESNFQK